MYAEGLPPEVRLKALTVEGRLPFVFEASGSETHLTNGFDPEPRARRVFAFPRPGTLARILRDAEADPQSPTWRAKVNRMPALITTGLRPAQIEAVTGIERSLAEQRFDRSLVQMATGAGKTFTAVKSSYRLLKHGGFRRVLFLVDRNNLGDQALREFQNYATPDDGRRFTELYNVDKLTGAGMVGSSQRAHLDDPSYFEQMKGRGARTISNADFQSVTPDAETKTRFVLIDAIGVTEHDYVDASPLERAKGVSLKKLLDKAASLTLTEDQTATLASRLAKLELQLTPAERQELDTVAGSPLKDVVRELVAAVDSDVQAQAIANAPVVDGVVDAAAAVQQLLDAAVRPLAANPALRQRILELRASHDQFIDEVSVDVLLDARGVIDVERAKSVVESWRGYLAEHRHEITALQVLYSQPRSARVSFAELRELAERIHRPPYNWTPDLIWNAYAAIEVDKVRHADRHTVTDLVSLVRFSLGTDNELVPYASKVEERYASGSRNRPRPARRSPSSSAGGSTASPRHRHICRRDGRRPRQRTVH